MPDVITPEERKMIDAALKRGVKVKRIPPGVSSYQMQWDEEKGGLRYVDPEQAAAMRSTTWMNGNRKQRRLSPEVAERRIKVRDKMDAGKTAREISTDLGVPISTIYQDAQKIGRKFSEVEPPKVATSKNDPVVSEARALVEKVFDPSKTVADIAEKTGLPVRTVRDHLEALNLTAAKAKRGTAAAGWRSTKVIERRERVKQMHSEGKSCPEMAKELGVSTASIHNDHKALDLEPIRKRRPNSGQDMGANVKMGQAKKRIQHIKDRRRFKTGVPATGEIRVMADADATGTIYPHTLANPDGSENVLKEGKHNAKIGGQVLVGKLKGAPIYTLTLEERATCPRSCLLWQGCYGNALNRSTRFKHSSYLMDRIEFELDRLLEQNEYILVRLHVLGDFWSIEYVSFWRQMLFKHPGLHVFGFTAHGPESEIGSHLAAIRGALPDRFWMRHSGACARWGSFTIDFPTERKTLGDAVVCPAQLDANEGAPRKVHCGSCAACWSCDRAIVFIEH